MRGMRWTIVTITIVLALASVMTVSGQTLALGAALATTGGFFAFLSPVVGWISMSGIRADSLQLPAIRPSVHCHLDISISQ